MELSGPSRGKSPQGSYRNQASSKGKKFKYFKEYLKHEWGNINIIRISFVIRIRNLFLE